MEKVTIYSIAEELGMSPSMVSRALSPNGSVDPQKKKLIIKTAEKHGFIPNKFASRLSGKHIKIGVFLYVRYRPVADKIILGIKEAYDELKDYKIEYEIKIVEKSKKRARDCEEDLFSLVDCDGVLVFGLGSKHCTDMLMRFYEKNPNLVQVQSVNADAKNLFSSKHDAALASGIAADFIYNCLRNSERKNVLLFTGDLSYSLHSIAMEQFKKKCEEYDLNLIDIIDMKDDENYLQSILDDVFSKYIGKIDAIYTTSGNCAPLCEYVKSRNINVCLVTFDTFPWIVDYIRCGTVYATISQKIDKQSYIAFTELVKYIMESVHPNSEIFTDAQLVMKSNIEKYI